MHRAVILLGLLVAAFGALLGALGSPPVAAASIVLAGALAVVAGVWLRRRTRGAKPPPDEPRPDEPRPDEPRPAEPRPPELRPVEDIAPVGSPVDAGKPPTEPLGLWPAEADAAIATGPAPGEGPAIPAQEGESRERQAIREAELQRESELNAIADELRALRSRDLSSTHIPEWKARIETWVDVDLRARAERGEEVTRQAAEWMRDFGEIPVKDWRRHLLRHLRRLGYRNYREGEW